MTAVGARDGLIRSLFLPVVLPTFLFGVGLGAVTGVQLIAAVQLGASDALASALMAIIGLVSLVLSVPVGAFIDRFGDRASMTFGTLAAALVTVVTVVALLVPGPWALPLYIGSLILRAPIEDAWRLARQAFVAELVPTWQMGRAMTMLGGTMRAGNLVGPLIASGLLLVLPLWSVFCFSVVAALLATVVLYLPGRRTGGQGTLPEPEPRQQGRLRTLDVRWNAVLLTGVAISVLSLVRAAQPIVVQLWGLRVGLSESGIALLVAIGSGVEMSVMVLGGYLKDRVGRSPTLVLCLLVQGIGFVLLGLEEHWVPGTLRIAAFVACVVVLGLGNGLGAGINMTIGADLSPAIGRARFLGAWAMFSNAGGLAGPTLITAVLAVSALPLAVVMVGATSLAGAGWMAGWARRVGLPSGVRGPS